MRELARSIARERMKRAGYTQINKRKFGHKSFFARNWRKAVDYQPNTVVVKHHKKRVKGLFKRRLFA